MPLTTTTTSADTAVFGAMTKFIITKTTSNASTGVDLHVGVDSHFNVTLRFGLDLYFGETHFILALDVHAPS
jgi:hypothetical protein